MNSTNGSWMRKDTLKNVSSHSFKFKERTHHLHCVKATKTRDCQYLLVPLSGKRWAFKGCLKKKKMHSLLVPIPRYLAMLKGNQQCNISLHNQYSILLTEFWKINKPLCSFQIPFTTTYITNIKTISQNSLLRGCRAAKKNISVHEVFIAVWSVLTEGNWRLVKSFQSFLGFIF